MSEKDERTKPKYESPVVLDLGELAIGSGECENGSVGGGDCESGGTTAGECEVGGHLKH